MRLNNKVAIVTGGTRGIGLAIAEAYLKEGATVVVASRKQDNLDSALDDLRKACGDDAPIHAMTVHTGQQDSCETLIKQTIDLAGKVDIVVNNAATNPHFGPLLQADAGQWQKTFDVNVMGYFWMTKYAAEHMIERGEGGKIINVASVVAFQPGFMMGVYSCSKAAIVMMTKSFAQELAPDNIQVNAIAPGFIKTRFSQALWGNDDLHDRLKATTPAGRMGESSEIAGAAVFLASDDSSFMTGDTMVVDGGVTLSGMG